MSALRSLSERSIALVLVGSSAAGVYFAALMFRLAPEFGLFALVPTLAALIASTVVTIRIFNTDVSRD